MLAHFYSLNVPGPRRDEGGHDDGADDGPSFNFSIWHISLWGDDNPEVVKTAPDWHDRFRVGGGDDTAVPQTFQTTQLLRWGRLTFFWPLKKIPF